MSSESPEDWGRRGEASLVALIVLVACIVVGARMEPGSPIVDLDHPMVDRMVAAGASAPVDTSDVVVLLIDDESMEKVGERWPMRRRTWADLITVLHSFEPAVIAVDTWFEKPEFSSEVGLALDLSDRLRLTGLADTGAGARLADDLDLLALESDGDRALAIALGLGTPVILGTACVSTPLQGDLTGLFTTDLPPVPRNACKKLSGNLAPLAASAKGQAGLDIDRDDDGLARRYPYVMQVGDVADPGAITMRPASLALAAVQVGRPAVAGAALERVAVLDGATPFLRVIDQRQFTRVSLADLLMPGPGTAGIAAALKGRLVFVGVNAQGTEDLAYNALGEVPGIFVHANAAVDLLQGRHIYSDGRPAQVGFALSVAVLAMVAWLGRRLRGAAEILALTLVTSVAWAGVGAASLQSGWVIPQIPVLAGLAGWGAVRLAFTWRRTDMTKRLAQAQREQLLADLEVRNAELVDALETLRTTRSAKERMEAELSVAHDIQLAMVPTSMREFPGRDRVAISTALEPAREVGGDFYDYFPLPDGRVCIVVGDVSGKGVGAALFMARTQTLLRVKAAQDGSPAQIVTHANDELARDNDTAMFVTLFFGIVDVGTGRMTWTNAGHNPPYVLKPDGSRVRLDQRHGPVVGAIEDFEFDEDSIDLGPGEQILAFTDGVTEAMDVGSALYGEPRLVAVLDKGHGDDAHTVRSVLADVRKFQGAADQADDITVLALLFHGVPG